jgi:DNA-binding NtrC family response regulator
VSAILRGRNHQVRAVASLADAQQALKNLDYDLIVADLQVCENAGRSGLRSWLRIHMPNLSQRVILMRASTPVGPQSDETQGAIQILQKPFKAGELLAAIESALNDASPVSIER